MTKSAIRLSFVQGIWYATWRTAHEGIVFVMAPSRERALAKALYSVYA